MKHIKIIFLALSLCLLTACSSNQTKYVRNILFDKDDGYRVAVEYYDFSSSDEEFKTVEINGEDAEKLCVTLQQQFNFNYRLCENIFITPNLLVSDLNLVFNTAGSLQIPAAVNVRCFLGEDIPKTPKDELIKTYLYNFSSQKGNVDGILTVYDENSVYGGAIVVSAGKPVKYIPENQWKIFNVITGDISDISLKFREGRMYAKLEKCNAYFYGDDNLHLNFTVSLKEYKGVSDAVSSKKLLVDFLKREIEDSIYRLYNDVLTAEFCNLYWYADCKNIQNTEIDVNVTVI